MDTLRPGYLDARDEMEVQVSGGRTVLLVHWDAGEAEEIAASLRSRWKVEIESEDGARVWARVKELRPRVLVVSLSRQPSHGRQTVLAVRRSPEGKNLPVVFVGGEADRVSALKKEIRDAVFTDHASLKGVLIGIGHDKERVD